MMTRVLAGLLCLAGTFGAKQDDLLQRLPKMHIFLKAGIQTLTKGDEVAISAKFELEEGKLSLSVYTVEKGLGADAEHNVLKEFAGNAEEDWAPKAEVFKDVEHVSRASMQLTLMSMTKLSLVDAIAKAEKDQAGMVYSITPKLKDRKAVFVVLVANQGKTVELVYDLLTGEKR